MNVCIIKCTYILYFGLAGAWPLQLLLVWARAVSTLHPSLQHCCITLSTYPPCLYLHTLWEAQFPAPTLPSSYSSQMHPFMPHFYFWPPSNHCPTLQGTTTSNHCPAGGCACLVFWGGFADCLGSTRTAETSSFPRSVSCKDSWGEAANQSLWVNTEWQADADALN